MLKRRSVNAPEFRNSAGTDLDALAVARIPESMNVPGFDFHPLHDKPKRYSVHANGPWCITFEWRGENALRVDLENYH